MADAKQLNADEREAEAAKTVGNVFISVSLMILAMILSVLFYWAYQRSEFLFFLVFVAIIFFYTVAHVGLFAALRHKLRPVVFRMYMGAGVFVSFMCMLVAIFLAIQYRKSSGSSSSAADAYVPPPVADYASPKY